MARIRSLWFNIFLVLFSQLPYRDGTSAAISTATVPQSSDTTSAPSGLISTTNTFAQLTISNGTATTNSARIASQGSPAVTLTASRNSTSFSSSSNVTTGTITTTTPGILSPTSSFDSLSPSTTFTVSSAIFPASFTPSSIPSPTTSADSTPDTHGDCHDDCEPKTTLYIWHIVLIVSCAFVLILFIFIGLLGYQNRALKKKLKTSRSYSLPIKENGAWIDNQDIPLWQKRASAFVSENPAETSADNPTLTT